MEDNKSTGWFYPTLFQGLGIVFLFILLSMITGMFISLGYLLGKPALKDFVEMLGYLLAAGGTLLVVMRVKRKVYQEQQTFNHQPVAPLNLFIVIGLTLLGLLAIDPLTNLLPMPEEVKKLFEQMFSKTLPAFFTAVVFAPLLEELIFRGIILEGFLKNYSPVKAIIWTNVLFGLAHLNPWQFIGAFLMGILISWVYFKSRNLLLPILMHLVNNLVSYLFLYLSDVPFSEASLKKLFSTPGLYITLVLGGIGLLVLFFVVFAKYFPFRRKRIG